MGGSMSQIFRSGSALLSNRDGHKVSETTIDKIQTIFDVLRANPRIPLHRLEALLLEVPRYENVLAVQDELGYNLLQKAIGLNRLDLVRFLLQRHKPDVNRASCSLPLHIACLKGHEEIVELLLKRGARIDTEARMCFPGPHSHNCEEAGKHKGGAPDEPAVGAVGGGKLQTTKLQNALCYALDGDHINVLNILSQKLEEPFRMPFRARKPLLLHLACEKAAWQCLQQLVITRSHEINVIKEEYYPIHQAVLHDLRFLELLVQHGASVTVRTTTQQLTLLHVVLLAARKSAEDTLNTLRLLLERGCKELINAPDSLGNTPLHALIVRYALEEAKYGYDKWNKWDILHLVRFFLAAGAKNSINQSGNSALACVFRHIRDWECSYELLNMLIREEGDPNIVGRDGSVPLMVCLVPLINKDPLHHFTHSMKVCYLNCIRILLQHGANPNCSYRANLTPLHVLIFTVSENFTLACDTQKRANFDFIKNILILLLQHGLDCNTTSPVIIKSVMDMIMNVRMQNVALDVACIYELTLVLIQYGADPSISLSARGAGQESAINDLLLEFDRGRGSLGTGASALDNIRNSFRFNGKNHLLFYFVMLVMRKDFIVGDAAQTYARVIHLFYLSMRHEPLFACLRSLHNLLIVQVPSRTTEQLSASIATLYKQPRSLKQMCRVTIYEALGRKLAQNVARLNLPPSLKEYMLSFDY